MEIPHVYHYTEEFEPLFVRRTDGKLDAAGISRRDLPFLTVTLQITSTALRIVCERLATVAPVTPRLAVGDGGVTSTMGDTVTHASGTLVQVIWRGRLI
jgi:hypothetical protein